MNLLIKNLILFKIGWFACVFGASRGLAWLGLLPAIASAQFPAKETLLEEPLVWEFKVFLNDKEIGRHDFRLSPAAEGLRLKTTASFDVKFLFFTAYTYRHRNEELWDSNGLLSIEATTNANGDVFEVRGRRDKDGFKLATGERARYAEGLKTFAYWNPAILKELQLLNSQTGEVEAIEVIDRGDEIIRYRGKPIPSRRFDLMLDEVPISVWYALEDQLWVALQSITEGGRILRYEPLTLPKGPIEIARRLN
jgi:hypothetical protein